MRYLPSHVKKKISVFKFEIILLIFLNIVIFSLPWREEDRFRKHHHES